jgi:hypothetical protein
MGAWLLQFTIPPPEGDGSIKTIQFDDNRFEVTRFANAVTGKMWKVEINTFPSSLFTDWDLNGLCWNMQQAGFPDCRVQYSTDNNPLQFVLITDNRTVDFNGYFTLRGVK